MRATAGAPDGAQCGVASVASAAVRGGPCARAVRPAPAAMAGSSNASRRVEPGRLGQADERRRGQPDRLEAGAGERTTGLADGDRAPGVEDDAPVQPAEDRRIVLGAQDRAAVARQLRQQRRDRRRPGRVELGGRLVEDEESRPHRHDAGDRHPLLLATGQRERLAVGQVRRSPAGSSTASIRPSISARGTPRFSRPKASSSRTVSFDADSWFAGVEKTIPTRPRSSPPVALPSASAPSVAVPRRCGADDPRDEPGGHEREGRLPGPGPAGDAEAARRARPSGRSPSSAGSRRPT